ncbi:hypothetical protein GOP47_0028715 [Adiantum capillus-veneris]|nr:hypothetical protein GOP47_0028715 [Adiantum capillus-veneris]
MRKRVFELLVPLSLSGSATRAARSLNMALFLGFWASFSVKCLTQSEVDWVKSRFATKLNRWTSYIARRALVVKHFLSAMVFFSSPVGDHLTLTYWTSLRSVETFYGQGTLLRKGLPRLIGKYAVYPKELGGLGLSDLNLWANKLAVKLILRALDSPDQEWQCFSSGTSKTSRSRRPNDGIKFLGSPCLFSPFLSLAKGSELLRSLWGSLSRDMYSKREPGSAGPLAVGGVRENKNNRRKCLGITVIFN